MGDFNDLPHSKALIPLIESAGMVCVTDSLDGSYRYKGKWEQIDHAYLSAALWQQGGDTLSLSLSSQGAYNFSPDFLLQAEPLYGGFRPHRTYNGMRYEGGTSDHLPLCFDLWFRW